MNEEMIKDCLNEAKPAVIEHLKKELLTNVEWDTKQLVRKEIEKVVKEWIAEEIVPEIKEQLIAEKGSLIEGISALGVSASEELVKGMRESIQENLKNSWGRKKLFEALLG